jgi:probable addiction module antidote protein
MARARGMTRVARAAVMSRENRCRALGEKRNPEFVAVVRVMREIVFRLEVRIAA